MKYSLSDRRVLDVLRSGEFGIELESLRVNGDGTLAKTAHPFDGDPNVTRDFCENQTEMITDVASSASGAVEQLAQLRKRVSEALRSQGEYLWRFSNPPAFSDPYVIPIADFKGSIYRDYLAAKYGKVKMLLSGIHLNFSLPSGTVELLANMSGKTLRETKDEVYLDLAAKLVSYSWLIVYLTAASPVLDESFAEFGGVSAENIEKYSSVRCGEAGYWNFFTPTFDYSSLESYIKSIERYIESGDIISCSELYYPIRIKPRGKYGTDTLLENGVNHVELRMIDINPLSDVGIFKEDAEFIHLLIIYLLCRDKYLPDEESQTAAVHNMKQAALMSEDTNILVFGNELNIKTAALLELNAMLDFSKKYFPQFAPFVEYQISKVNTQRYAVTIRQLYGEEYMISALARSTQSELCVPKT